MELIHIFYRITKYTIINLSIVFILFKICNCNLQKKNQNLLLSFSFILSIILVIISLILKELLAYILIYFIYVLIIKKFLKKSLNYTFFNMIISSVIAYTTYVFSVFITSILSLIVFPNQTSQIQNAVIITIGYLIYYIVILRILNIKKLKKGINFLKDDKFIKNNTMQSIIIYIITISLLLMIGIYDDSLLLMYMIFIIIIIILLIYFWIQKEQENYYINSVKDRTIESLEKEVKDLKMELNIMDQELFINLKENHKINHNIKLLTDIVLNIQKNNKTDSKTNKYLLDELKRIKSEYDIKTNNKEINVLQPTGNYAVDKLFDYMNREAKSKNIDFEIKINVQVSYLIKKYISEENLITFLSDHIKNAIIAINNNNNVNKRVFVLIGMINGNHGISIYDTGIEFKIETLVKLFKEATTTHKKTGGTGFGFMTTLDTINQTKASFEITENVLNKSNYTKSIALIFDNKKEYRVSSHRWDSIKKLDLDNRIKLISKKEN